jgi:hypothetical protein
MAICKRCGREFEPAYGAAGRFCSRSCYQRIHTSQDFIDALERKIAGRRQQIMSLEAEIAARETAIVQANAEIRAYSDALDLVKKSQPLGVNGGPPPASETETPANPHEKSCDE